MDSASIMQHLQMQWNNFSPQNGAILLQHLNHKEYVDIEDKKTALFKSKLDFLVLSKCIREAMVRDTGYRQLKRYFVNMFNMPDDQAAHAADKYNEGCRVFDRFDQVIQNVEETSGLDIRDLTLHELALAHRKNWVIRRATISKKKKKSTPGNQGGVLEDVDWADVENSVNNLTTQNWFIQNNQSPPVIAIVMDHISDRVLSKAL